MGQRRMGMKVLWVVAQITQATLVVQADWIVEMTTGDLLFSSEAFMYFPKIRPSICAAFLEFLRTWFWDHL